MVHKAIGTIEHPRMTLLSSIGSVCHLRMVYRSEAIQAMLNTAQTAITATVNNTWIVFIIV